MSGIAFDRNVDAKWRDAARQILERIPAALDEHLNLFRRDIGTMEKVRSYFLDADEAILAGDRGRLGRDDIECRLCGAMFDADDGPRIVHLRMSHPREMREAFR